MEATFISARATSSALGSLRIKMSQLGYFLLCLAFKAMIAHTLIPQSVLMTLIQERRAAQQGDRDSKGQIDRVTCSKLRCNSVSRSTTYVTALLSPAERQRVDRSRSSLPQLHVSCFAFHIEEVTPT